MSVAPGWYSDGQQLRYWNGVAWGLQGATESGIAGIEARYRVVGQPGISLSHSEFGDLATVGARGEYRTAQALEELLEKYRHAWLFHSVRIDGQAWDIDHVLIIGRVVFFVDTKNWRGNHDYLLRFNSEYEPPASFADGPRDPRFVQDGVVRHDRTDDGVWESFPGSVVRLRGLAERFAEAAGIHDPEQYRFVPLLVVAKDNVTTMVEGNQPSWLQFAHLGELEERIEHVLQVEHVLADGHEPMLHSLFTKFQANSIVPAEATVQSNKRVVHYASPVAAQPGHRSAHVVEPVDKGENAFAVPAMIVGIVSLFMPLFLGVLVAGTGLGLSIVAMKRAGRTGGHRKGMAITGLVTSIVGLVLII